jgi:hypothetical protein
MHATAKHLRLISFSRDTRSWLELLPFALSMFRSASLVFQVRLVGGKCVLPWFGGTPAVFATCMLFFQVVLVGGYAYSHVLKRLRRVATYNSDALWARNCPFCAGLRGSKISLYYAALNNNFNQFREAGSAIPALAQYDTESAE